MTDPGGLPGCVGVVRELGHQLGGLGIRLGTVTLLLAKQISLEEVKGVLTAAKDSFLYPVVWPSPNADSLLADGTLMRAWHRAALVGYTKKSERE